MNQHDQRRSESETIILRDGAPVPLPEALEEEVFASLTLALSAQDPQVALAHLINARNFLFAAAKLAGVARDGHFSFSLVDKTVSTPLEEHRR